MVSTTRAKVIRGRAGLAVVFLGFLAAAPGYGQVSVFAANEFRAASLKDRLRIVKTTLTDGTEGSRRHSTAVDEAFKDSADWAPDTEAYYARKNDLLSRAAALEAKLDAALARNTPERGEDATRDLEAVCKKGEVLRSDYEFYMRLPRLADGPQRLAARSAMRLLAQTGDYPVSLAYFLDKTPNRPPFAPLPPGVMAIRHK